ncbi:hypothetical protein [Corynebacterium sp.]|uniref:hypothetical protein n=1 Tax=Corynebacterium sp. TaxID=1720 RepID=UPI0026DB97ED|nr:hypothetical protein [Corynebacterium sp.]MDO5031487.1 hypothetical protein [Corynebacterium sp.]
MKPTRVMTTLAALALGAGTAAACSTAPENTTAEPSFENTYPAFEPLQKEGQADVPDRPEPSMNQDAGQHDAGEGADQSPAQQQATAGGGQADQYIEHNTNQDVKLANYDELSSQIPQGKASGFDVNLKGTKATVCLMGDGYGITFVMAGKNTSCEFAETTARTLMGNAPSSKSDLRNFVPPQLNATSPVTNKAYNLSCSIDENEVIRCTGGNDAEVLIL